MYIYICIYNIYIYKMIVFILYSKYFVYIYICIINVFCLFLYSTIYLITYIYICNFQHCDFYVYKDMVSMIFDVQIFSMGQSMWTNKEKTRFSTRTCCFAAEAPSTPPYLDTCMLLWTKGAAQWCAGSFFFTKPNGFNILMTLCSCLVVDCKTNLANHHLVMDGLKPVLQKQKQTGHWAAVNMASTWSKAHL